MTVTDTPAPLIEDLFCQGHPLAHVVDVGVEVGWTREDVMAVLREQQWDLDASGRLPRSKRVTTPLGLRHLPATSMKAPAPTTNPARTFVPDRLTGAPLPVDPPTPAEAMAEQAELDEPVGADDSDDADDEEFCPECCAGTESSEHNEKCVAPQDLAEEQTAPTSTNISTTPGVYIAALQGGQLGVDHTYQRPLEQPRVKKMVAEWDPRRVGVVDVSDRGPQESPRYAVVNGQHRAAAAAIATGLGPDVWLVCNVHEGLTVADEARLMHELDRGTKKLSGHDQWRARRVAGDEAVTAVERVAARHGLRVDAALTDGVVRSYGTAEKLLKLGGEQLLDQALAVLRAAYDTAAAGYQAPLFMAVGQLLHGCADLDVDRLTRALAANRPEHLRAAATVLRDELPGPLHALMATAIADAYNRTPGSGPRITWSH